MALSVGTLMGYVSLDVDEFDKRLSAVDKALQDAGKRTQKTGAKQGTGFSAAMGKALKVGGKAAAGGFAAVLGTSLFKGFKRLNALDQAKAKLSGLGYNGKQVAGIMDSVGDAVTGTAFGLDEAGTAAAGALASGIKPGKDLTKFLALTGDAATQAGTDFNSMAMMMNKVQGQGKLTGDVVNQLAENGLYVMPMLAKAFGKPQAAMQKMVSEGKVSSAEFQKVLTDNIGGSAQKSGKTVAGAWKNMQAALGRVGANLLGGIFSKLPGAFTGITKAMKPMEKQAARAGEKMGKALKDIGPVVADISKALAKGLVKILPKLGEAFVKVIEVAAKIVKFFTKHKAAAIALGIAVGALTAIIVAYDAAMAVAAAGGMAKWLLQTKLISAATKVFSAVQWALNAAMSANPIVLVVAAVAALVAGVIIAYKKVGWFRDGVNAAFGAIKAVATSIGKFFTQTLPNFFKNAWNKIVSVTKSLVTGYVNFYVKLPGRILSALGSLGGKLKSLFTGAMNAAKTAVVSGASRVVDTVKAIPGKIKDIAGDFASAGKALIRAMIRGLGKLGNVAKDFANDIWQAIKNVINAGIDKLNNMLEFDFKVKGIGFTVNAPDIPHLATGGRATSSTIAEIGEGREPETVLPDSVLRGLLERVHESGRASAGGGDGSKGRNAPLIGQVTTNQTDPRQVAEQLWYLTRTRG